MKQIFNVIFLVSVASLPLVCCETKKEGSSEFVDDRSYDTEDADLTGGKGIDGRKWTLADLSNSFDENLTLKKAFSLYGNDPGIENIEGGKILTYEIYTENSHENGVRMVFLKLKFYEDKLDGARIVFAKYEDP